MPKQTSKVTSKKFFFEISMLDDLKIELENVETQSKGYLKVILINGWILRPYLKIYTIINNSSLNNIQKFKYLQSSLSGDTASIIKVTNSRNIIELINTVKLNLRYLELLGINEEQLGNILLTTFILKKIDGNMNKDFELSLKENTYLINLSSLYDNFKFETRALIVKDLLNKIPNFYTHNSVWPHLNNLELADPEFYIPRPIDIIIGADLYLDLIESGFIKGPRDAPSAMNSKLGWIISGRSNMPNNTTSKSIQQIHVNHSLAELDAIVKKNWDAESIPTHKEEMNTEELECENIFRTTTFRYEKGRYVVSLPFRLNHIKMNYQLGDSKSQALRRFLSLERRFHQNPVYEYSHVREFMQDNLNIGHMEVINEIEPEQPSHQVYYMPYHAVLREQSTTTELRMVFDASAKTSTGLSLNDLLLCM
ncbi:hypothetical protein LAZ67_19001906 [Cordylochernes scorpioides]|uniref:Peptidase aspartic putative domain-containing protein n=1 Tax=Cordylochernes scorpioides TaxID=51811 RepID=A0ABY6LI32_9ARAC|nr:hypothetical protein LAZ67_19001906 [Cordylochernes scorpioides]